METPLTIPSSRISGTLASGGGGAIIIAGSNASAQVKRDAITSGGAVCTGTNDDVVINGVLNLLGDNAYVKAIGTFNVSQMFRQIGSYSILDLKGAIFNIPSNWAAAGRSVIQWGANHQIPLGAATLPGGNGTSILFTASSGGAAAENGDFGYLFQSTGTYSASLSSSTKYYIVNYTPTGFGGATYNLSLIKGGSPITGTGTVSGTYSLVPFVGVSTGSSNSFTLTDATITPFSDGTPIVTGVVGSSGLSVTTVYYTKLVSGVTFNLYTDVGLNQQVTLSTANKYFGLGTMTIAPKILGGVFNLLSGTANALVVGVVKVNLAVLGGEIDGMVFNWGTNIPSTGCSIYDWGSKSRIHNATFIGGPPAISAIGSYNDYFDNVITGAYQGIITNSNAPGYHNIHHNQIHFCQAEGVFLAGVGTQVSYNTFLNNCLGQSISAFNLFDGTGNNFIGPNVYNILGIGPGGDFTAANSKTSLMSPVIVSSAKILSQGVSATTTLLTYSLPGNSGNWNSFGQLIRLSCYFDNQSNAFTGIGSFAIQVSYVDDANVTQTTQLAFVNVTGSELATKSVFSTTDTTNNWSSMPIDILTFGTITVSIVITGAVSLSNFNSLITLERKQ